MTESSHGENGKHFWPIVHWEVHDELRFGQSQLKDALQIIFKNYF
jgi:hypothetical protein